MEPRKTEKKIYESIRSRSWNDEREKQEETLFPAKRSRIDDWKNKISVNNLIIIQKIWIVDNWQTRWDTKRKKFRYSQQKNRVFWFFFLITSKSKIFSLNYK